MKVENLYIEKLVRTSKDRQRPTEGIYQGEKNFYQIKLEFQVMKSNY